jgi:hypothetical protein
MYMVVFSKFLSEKYKGHTTEELSGEKFEALVRDSLKMTFQKILNILEWNQEHNTDILFAKDGYRLWRKERLFSGYKQHRKGKRDATNIDFRLVFKVFDRVWSELKNILPFRFITLEHIEVDDIIFMTINAEMDKYDKFQIYSTDSDFRQTLRYEKVELYNPRITKFIESDNPEYDLFEKIITGDKSDGIPNIYADSINERQKPIFKKRVKNWFDDRAEFKTFLKAQPVEVQKRFVRNKRLIDMRDIPEDIQREICVALENDRNQFDLQKYIKVAKKYFITVMEEKADLIPNEYR